MKYLSYEFIEDSFLYTVKTSDSKIVSYKIPVVKKGIANKKVAEIIRKVRLDRQTKFKANFKGPKPKLNKLSIQKKAYTYLTNKIVDYTEEIEVIPDLSNELYQMTLKLRNEAKYAHLNFNNRDPLYIVALLNIDAMIKSSPELSSKLMHHENLEDIFDHTKVQLAKLLVYTARTKKVVNLAQFVLNDEEKSKIKLIEKTHCIRRDEYLLGTEFMLANYYPYLFEIKDKSNDLSVYKDDRKCINEIKNKYNRKIK